MGKQLINQVECEHCGKMFDVNTEDIEWENVADLGVNEEHAPLHDYVNMQTTECPYCGKENTIVYKAIEDLQTGTIHSQEVKVIDTKYHNQQ